MGNVTPALGSRPLHAQLLHLHVRSVAEGSLEDVRWHATELLIWRERRNDFKPEARSFTPVALTGGPRFLFPDKKEHFTLATSDHRRDRFRVGDKLPKQEEGKWAARIQATHGGETIALGQVEFSWSKDTGFRIIRVVSRPRPDAHGEMDRARV